MTPVGAVAERGRGGAADGGRGVRSMKPRPGQAPAVGPGDGSALEACLLATSATWRRVLERGRMLLATMLSRGRPRRGRVAVTSCPGGRGGPAGSGKDLWTVRRRVRPRRRPDDDGLGGGTSLAPGTGGGAPVAGPASGPSDVGRCPRRAGGGCRGRRRTSPRRCPRGVSRRVWTSQAAGTGAEDGGLSGRHRATRSRTQGRDEVAGGTRAVLSACRYCQHRDRVGGQCRPEHPLMKLTDHRPQVRMRDVPHVKIDSPERRESPTVDVAFCSPVV